MGAVQIYGSPVDKKRFRKMAVGTAPWSLVAGGSILLDISGLKFKPRYIIAVDYYGATTRYIDRTDFCSLTGYEFPNQVLDEDYKTVMQLIVGIGRGNVTDSGFKIYVENLWGVSQSGNVKWIALGW